MLTRRRYDRPVDPTGPGAGAGPPVGEPDRRRVRRIVLTGGPGSGKSTAASFLAREFPNDVWVLPEAATLLYSGGMPRGDSTTGVRIAQRSIFQVQRSLEHAHGVQHPERVQLCDRATVDGAAYWPDGPDAFFTAMGTTPARELSRYDIVIFLHTAALLPAGYERDLTVRTEDVQEAAALDARMFELWSDHPRVVPVASQGSFLAKLTLVREAVCEAIAPSAALVSA